MIRICFHSEGEDVSRNISQDSPTVMERSLLLAEIEIFKKYLIDSFKDDWEVEEQ